MNFEIRQGIARKRLRIVSEPVFLVGANGDCDLVLGDPQFSPIHFYLLRRDGVTLLRRVGLSPEVSINGRVANTAIIHEGDRIRTGPFEFVVRAA